ncbi:DNA adenine methylase [Paramagnetospirillum magneticum]|nr:DNA adenine methylase [Paramagnetospirillum magneticum]
MTINLDHRSVTPVDPAVGYIGGKRNLAGAIVPLIQSIPHTCYAEPFAGMGGIFFRRTRVPRSEVINDASRDVAVFFRILQRHFPQMMDVLKFQITSRAEFERLCRVDPDTLTDLERSARFLYLQATAYGGKVATRTFGVDPRRGGRFNVTLLAQRLAELHERLAGVVLECLDFEAFIRRYDRPFTLFYVDPPYAGSEGYYGKHLFKPDDLVRLATALKGVQGWFITSNADCPEVREAFAGCEIREVRTTYTAGGRGRVKAGREVIIIGGGNGTG